MEMALDTSEGYIIQEYSLDYIQVGDKKYTDSLIISPDKIIAPWHVQTIDSLSKQDCLVILKLSPDIVLLGTGAQQLFPSIEILNTFAKQHIGIEVMSTGAACRTYNVLVSEDRKVVAAFIL